MNTDRFIKGLDRGRLEEADFSLEDDQGIDHLFDETSGELILPKSELILPAYEDAIAVPSTQEVTRNGALASVGLFAVADEGKKTRRQALGILAATFAAMGFSQQEVEANMPPEKAKKAKEEWIRLIMSGKEGWKQNLRDSIVGKRHSYVAERYYAGPYEKKWPMELGVMDWTKDGKDVMTKEGEKIGHGFIMQAKKDQRTKKPIKNEYWYGLVTLDDAINTDNPFGIFLSKKLSKNLQRSKAYMDGSIKPV